MVELIKNTWYENACPAKVVARGKSHILYQCTDGPTVALSRNHDATTQPDIGQDVIFVHHTGDQSPADDEDFLHINFNTHDIKPRCYLVYELAWIKELLGLKVEPTKTPGAPCHIIDDDQLIIAILAHDVKPGSNIFTSYKSKQADISVFYCPYIPLAMTSATNILPPISSFVTRYGITSSV